MTCTAQIFLSGFCTLSTAIHLEHFDPYRFGIVETAAETAFQERIEQAFVGRSSESSDGLLSAYASPTSLPDIKFPIKKPKPVITALLAIPVQKDEPVTEPEIVQPKIEKRAPLPNKKTGKRSWFGKNSATPKSTRQRRVFWPFKKKQKIPDGINLNASGYKEVHKAALKHGVDVGFALKVAKQESRGNCNATSSANAKGVMQVIPGTARKHGLRQANSLYNCKIGADIGVRELKSCLNKARGNQVQALVCYNAGPAWITSPKYRGRRIPSETRNYIKIITGKSVAKVT